MTVSYSNGLCFINGVPVTWDEVRRMRAEWDARRKRQLENARRRAAKIARRTA